VLLKITKGLIVYYKYTIVLFALAFSLNGFCQTKKELISRKNENIERLKLSKNLLHKTEAQKRYSVNQLLIIQKGIKYRESLIRNIEDEISYLENDIEAIDKNISNNVDELRKYKSEYATIIRGTYRNLDSRYALMFILSSEDINQGYQRIKYLKYLATYRKEVVQKIDSLNIELLERQDSMNNMIEEKETTIQDLYLERRKLSQDKSNKNNIIKNLSKKEEELKDEIKRRENIQNKIEDEIRKIIEEEARKARESNMVTRLTPEQKLVSDAFGRNKGLLPWPTEQGIITGYFGEQDHPVLKGIKIKRNGVDINTSPGSFARAVFKGEVTKVVAIPGANYTVIITHGDYRTVYQNLINVRVKSGDKIETKEYLGEIYTGNDSQCRVHFEVWQNMNILNPEYWLSK